MFKYLISRLISKFCLFLVEREISIWNSKSGVYTYLENYYVIYIKRGARFNAVGIAAR